MRLRLAICAAALLPAAALSQTMVESAILSGSVAASASGSAAATGGALSRALGNVDATLSRAAGGASTLPGRTSATKSPPLPTPPQAAFEGVKPGTPRTDLIGKAGKPQFAIAGSDDELLRYTTKEGGIIRIRIVDGKVDTIDQTPPRTVTALPPANPANPLK